ncbi:MAG: hypothetical protein KF815_08065 [Rhodospirillales bacterium]|nr:hypothetical protein [Rhodospirillales bacterium]
MDPSNTMAGASAPAALQVYQLTRAALLLVWDAAGVPPRTRLVAMNGGVPIRTRFITTRLSLVGHGSRTVLALVHHGASLDAAGLSVRDLDGHVIAHEEEAWRGEPLPFDAARLLAGLDPSQRIAAARFVLMNCPAVLQLSHNADYVVCCRELLSELKLKAQPFAPRARVADSYVLCECVTPKRLGQQLGAVVMGGNAIARPLGTPVACPDPRLPAGLQRVAVLLDTSGLEAAPISLLIFGKDGLAWRRATVDGSAVPAVLDWLAGPEQPSRAARWCLTAGLTQLANERPAAAQRLIHEIEALAPPAAAASVRRSPALNAGLTQAIATPAGLLVQAWLSDPHDLVGAIAATSISGRQTLPIDGSAILPPPPDAPKGSRGFAALFPAADGTRPDTPCQIELILRSGHTIEIGEGPGPLRGAAALDAILKTPLQAAANPAAVAACIEPAIRTLIGARTAATTPLAVHTFGTLPRQPRAGVVIPIDADPAILAAHEGLAAAMPEHDGAERVYVLSRPDEEAATTARLAELQACYGGGYRLVVMPGDAGGASGLNAAAALISAPVLAFLGEGIIPEAATWLDALLHALAIGPVRSLVAAPTLYHDGSIAAAGADAALDAFGRWEIRNRFAGFPRGYPALVKAAAAPIAATGCCALPRVLFEAVGGFSLDYLGRFHRDADLAARVWQADGHTSVAREPYVIALRDDLPQAAGDSALARELDRKLFEARWRSFIEAAGAAACDPPRGQPTAVAKARPRHSRPRKRAA